MQKITTRWLNENAVKCDRWTFKDGVYLGRKSYFWSPKQDINAFASDVVDQINAFIETTHTVTLQDCGNVWKAFKGGASIANQSHYWVKVTIQPIENQPE